VRPAHFFVAVLGDDHDVAAALTAAVACENSSDVRLTFDWGAPPDDETRCAWLLAALRRTAAQLLIVSFTRDERPRVASLVESVRRGGWTWGIVLASSSLTDSEWIELLDTHADDYLVPPFRHIDVSPRLARWCRPEGEPGAEIARLKESLGLQHFVGQSPHLLEALRRISVAARRDISVMLLGETGTGKEIAARMIHYLSPRSGGPFVPVNSGAIPAELVENELFGHEAGAFTGAAAASPGLIHEASGGTLFLDEIDCLPLAAQVKLLRVVQEREYRPLGSRRTLRADVRIVSASNGSLEEAVRAGRFRRDLYYRLNVIQVDLPPLRERRDDIPLLVRHFVAKHVSRFDCEVKEPTPAAVQRLMRYTWPGNVRELENVIERALVVSCGARIEATDILLPGIDVDPPPLAFSELKAQVVERFERDYLESMLATHGGNISRAARAAGKNRRAFWELMRKHRIRVCPAVESGPNAVEPAAASIRTRRH